MLELSDLRTVPLFDGLRDDQLEELLDGGAEVPIVPGEVVWLRGRPRRLLVGRRRRDARPVAPHRP